MNPLKFLYSFRWRVAVPYIIFILVTLGSLGQYSIHFIIQAKLNSLENRLISEAQLLADFISTNNFETEDGTWDQNAVRWSEILGARVTFISADGNILAESYRNSLEIENHLDKIEIQEASEKGIGKSERFSQTLGEQMIYVAVPVYDAGQIISFVRLSVPVTEVETRTTALVNSIVLAFFFTAAISVLVAIVIANFVSRPIREINTLANKISQDVVDQKDIQSSDDEIHQLSITIRRVNQSLRDEIASLQSERVKLSTVLRQMTDGILIIGPNGDIELINPAAERIFDIREEYAKGRSLTSVLRHHRIDELWRQSQTNRQDNIAAIELSIKTHYLQAISIPLGKSFPGSTLFLFQDLTNLRRLETIRRDFISNISHELRTPLASLKALTETLQEGALEDPIAARHFLSNIESEVDSIAQLVQELLELARIESGKVPLVMENILPNDLVRPIVDRMYIQAKRSGIEIKWECPDTLPHVLADPPRMEQVISNLLNNAIKFTPSGGEIVISCREKEDSIEFSVKDNGVGIPVDDLMRIFERFYKADRARSGGGTGLGLAISRHLVEAHQGRIWVQSEEGKGSTFSFTLLKAPNL